MFNAFTGTHPDYRGRRIALALKLHTIRLARRLNLAHIRTYNDSHNVPMLAINDKLGYVRQPGRYQLMRRAS
jgi:RimJ/RimL family protein N-acetyltransferase